MTWTTIAITQILLTCHPSGDAPVRFGFPLSARAVAKGLRIDGAPRARLQWRRLQRRPDRSTGRVWVELCITGARGRVRIAAGGAGPSDPAEGAVVRRESVVVPGDGGRVSSIRWRWHTGEVDEIQHLDFSARQEHQGEAFEAGESLTLGLTAERFVGASIGVSQWRRAGVLPRSGKLGEEYRRRLRAAAGRLVELEGLRDRGDYRRSGEVMTNLEFDTTLTLARLGLDAGDGALLTRALQSAVHSVDHDLDGRTSLLFRHGKGHRTAPPDLGHTWLSGVLLVGCLAAQDRLILAAERIAHGIAEHPAIGEGRNDRVRDVGWPLAEMETWLRFADDAQVAKAVAGLIRRLVRRWDPRNKVFQFGEGKGRTGVYEDPLWVTAGCLLPGLRAYVARTGDREVAGIVRALSRRLSQLVRAGKPGLPTRFWVVAGKVISTARVTGTASCFMVLEGLAPGDLRRCLQRKMVRKALLEVPSVDDVDLATTLSIVGRCEWIYR